MQAEAESPPRKRFGLFEGFRRRNKSESAAGSRDSTGLRLWGSKLPGAHQPKAIAESEEEEEPGVAVYESPRLVTRPAYAPACCRTVSLDVLGCPTLLIIIW